MKIKQNNYESSHLIAPDNENHTQILKIKKQKPKSQRKDYQKYLQYSAIILVGIGLIIYLIAMRNFNINNTLNSFSSNSSNQIQFKDTQRYKEQLAKLNNQNLPINNQRNIQNNEQPFKDTTKKLSAQISIQKLIRARQMFKNITQPIGKNIYEEERQQFKNSYKIFDFDEKPICIVVPTFNNVKDYRYRKNIESILQQQYTNYKVVIIDDASQDNTATHIQNYIKNREQFKQGKIKIQKNKYRKMALPNILDAAYNFCQPHDIFMIIDGDDYLLGKLVFKLFNAAFSSTDAWVVYSNFLTINSKIGYSRRYPTQIINKNLFRKVMFIISHLRAFYTKLLLNVDKQDLKDENGQYFHAANDVSIFMPILQMARDHLLYLRQINYFYNANTGLNNHFEKKKEQVRNDKYIRSKISYPKLQNLFQNQNI